MTKLKITGGMVGHGVPFQRTRRITGYLTDMAKMNEAKLAELRDRVPHFAAGASAKT